MAREVDPKKTRKAMRRLSRARKKIEDSGQADTLSDWEDEFLDSVGERLDTYGSAFNDPDKGRLDEPLSGLQTAKLREIEKKAMGKTRKPMSRGKGFKPSFRQKGPGPRVRDIHEDIEDDAPADDAPPQPPRPSGPPRLRVVKGDKTPD